MNKIQLKNIATLAKKRRTSGGDSGIFNGSGNWSGDWSGDWSGNWSGDWDDNENNFDISDSHTWVYKNFTNEEYEQMVEDGAWHGGYVNGIYYMPVLNVYGSYSGGNNPGTGNTGGNNSGTGNTGSSNNVNNYPSGVHSFNDHVTRVPPVEGVGINASYRYAGYYIIHNNNFHIHAEVSFSYPTATYSAIAILYVNGIKSNEYQLSLLPNGYIVNADFPTKILGDADVPLPESGNVSIEFKIIEQIPSGDSFWTTLPHTKELFHY